METNELQDQEMQVSAGVTTDQVENAVAPTSETVESNTPQDAAAGTEHDPNHPHHPHNSALLAASMGHSAVNHVKPHHRSHLDD